MPTRDDTHSSRHPAAAPPRDPAVAARVAVLTERQRTYLRLAIARRTSKEIAAATGDGYRAVDQQFLRINAILGVPTRSAAAHLFAAFERAEASGAADDAPTIDGPAPIDRDELVDVVVRLPRKAVEDTLLSAMVADKALAARRLGEAKALLTGRLRRVECFTGVRFSDPSFDMILQLYVATREQRLLTVSQLTSLSGGSTTTALRHIDHLEALGYIAREADKDDKRRANVTMLPRLLDAADQWLDLQIAASRLGC